MNFTATFKNLIQGRPGNAIDPEGRGADPGKILFGGERRLGPRFRAWWHGVPLSHILATGTPTPSNDGLPDGAPPVTPAATPGEDVPGGPWSSARISISELLFGSGEIVPGGTARTLDMIGAFGLGTKLNVLNIGAGLGGAARAIAIEYDGWITGYESDPVLAAAAMAPERADKLVSSVGTGRTASKLHIKLSDKAKVEHAGLAELKLKKNTYDCAFARDAFFTVTKKAAVLKKIFSGLKPYSPFLLTDYFMVEGAENNPAFQRWRKVEPVPPCLWTVKDFSRALTDSGFDLRICDDITDQVRADTIRDFDAFIVRHETRGVSPHLVEALLDISELWACRIMAMDAGVIAMHKLVGLKIP